MSLNEVSFDAITHADYFIILLSTEFCTTAFSSGLLQQENIALHYSDAEHEQHKNGVGVIIKRETK